MRDRQLLGVILGFLALHGVPAAVAQAGRHAAGWRDAATADDRSRVRNWRRIWIEGLRSARQTRARDVAAAGVLLDPDAALVDPAPPPGAYLCRTIKLGAQGRGLPDWTMSSQSRCRIGRQGPLLTFALAEGAQRPMGRIYPESVRRMILLGSLQLGDERRALPYGADAQRNVTGILERIGVDRWRLVFPHPAFESIIDVVELVPAT